MGVEWMRNKIREIYPGWMALYSMPDSQIKAIYFSMRNNGKFKNRKKKKDSETYVQMTIFDFM